VRVFVSHAAERDLEAIADHIAIDSPAAARNFLRKLRTHCAELGQFPARYPIMQGRTDADIRRRVSGNYLIFYRIEPKRVVILRILHAALDPEDRLFPG
jgi:toxin ParE1/3/4